MSATNGYETVIGLEVHVELATASKMFCGCPTGFGAEPNTQVCPVCLGEPGSLPVPNRKAIEYTMMIGMALGCEIAPHSIFHRKNYFYPDMPKNYQISQYDFPLCVGGALEIEMDATQRRVGITRVHLEEDTGKSLHVGATGRIAGAKYSLVDYNRAGIALVEVVSEPDVRSAAEAQKYLSELRSILESLGVSDVRMEEGSMRCDANVSLRRRGDEYGTRVEIKNLNSIRSLGRALAHEVERQTRLLETGEVVVQETRHFDEGGGVTKTLRSKEEAFDYRYFPEPDLLPLAPDAAWLSSIRAALPELPAARRARLSAEHELTPAQAAAVGGSVAWVRYFEETVAAGTSGRDAAVWMAGEVSRAINAAGSSIEEARVSPQRLAALIAAVGAGTVNLNTAKRVFQLAFESAEDPADIIEREGLGQVSDTSAIERAIEQVLAENAPEVERFRAGEEKVLGFLVGKAMRALGGKGNPKLVNETLRRALGGS